MFKYRPICFIISLLLIALSAAMLLPALADGLAGNPDWLVFLVSAGVTLAIGGMLALQSIGGDIELNLREAFLLTTAAWVALSAFAALPFVFSTLGIDYTDAFFEAISGLTTTGSTVLVGLDTMPPGLLLWRALLQWMGGIGIIVMAVAILPFLRVGGMQLFQTESSDRSDKILPRPGQIASAILSVYIALTVACAVLYAAFGMTGFDALAHAMTTLATGGYSTKDGSISYFNSPGIEWVGTVFMIAGALPFVLYVRAIQGRVWMFWGDSQVRVFLTSLLIIVGLLTLWLWSVGLYDPATALRLAAFNVVSIVTTTGYASADYGAWGGFAVMMILIVTFLGGCSGSTSGAIKIFRFQVLAVILRWQLNRLFSPNGVFPRRYNGRPLADDAQLSVVAFFALFVTTFGVVAILLGAVGLDFISAVSGAATALANVGPGLGSEIGPSGNFANLPDIGKWILSAAMLLGRLELFTVYVLFLPQFWRG
ncbi:TrkH family potassium uptake protein [Ferruginivarius sediminum]|uniref:Trk system potassium uptake protein n=1 Tax=Ferruginivarius sediminum TaxID=2661937 RepID=A0A369T8Y3_9PROT|nr:TrkH family potassium uptake protein [Ferruginivarius sediminum]RDD61763.1 TrkH family potassium uptake protein [Ferruginivarius sediminum]